MSVIKNSPLLRVLVGLSILGASFYAKPALSDPNTQAASKQASPTMPDEESIDVEPDLPVSTSDWTAFENRMPVGFPTLYVKGQVQLPNPGYSAELVRPIEQTYMDDTLMLVLRIDGPSGNFVYPGVIETETVRYEDEFYIGDYEQVIVRGEDGSVIETIPVSVVE